MTVPARVLIIGEDAPGAIADSYARGFRELGAEVTRYCIRRAFVGALPGARSRVARRLLRPLVVRAFNRKVVADLADARADLVLVIKGEHLSGEAIEALRQNARAPVVNFYPDDPFSRTRSNRMTFGPETLASYDACFTFARHLEADYRRVGVERVHYLPFARDPYLHAPVAAAGAPEFDLVFVGNLDAERVRWLSETASFRLAVFGVTTRASVPAGSPLARATFFPAAYGAELAQALARGAISVNVMRVQNRGSHNMRSFESPACGAFTLSQRTPELVQLFREGREIACFESPEELRAQIDHWLSRPRERAEVAAEGFRRVEHDTYRVRAQRVLDAAILQ